MIIAIAFPIFYEGDAQYHFDYSSYQVNTVVDRSIIGSTARFGYDQEVESINKGNYFEDYFIRKLPLVDKNMVTDKRTLNRNFRNDFWHLIPSLGIKIGYFIYPSIGSMIVCARILMCIIYSFVVFFLIKKLNYGKKLLFITALSPVMMIEGISLSYDSPSFLITATLFVIQSNIVFNHRRDKSNLLKLLIATTAVFVFAKDNMRLLILFSLVILADWILDFKKLLTHKKNRIFLFSLAAIFFITGYIYFAYTHGGLKHFTLKMYNTVFTIENEQYTRGMFLGILGNFTASYSLPWWCLYGYSVIIFLLIASEKRPKIFWMYKLSALIIFIGNILGVTAMYSTFSNSVYDANNIRHIIGGQLGRYYTPFLPLLSYLDTGSKINLTIEESFMKKIVVIWSVFCLTLLVINTLYGFYYLKIPAFVQ